MRRRELLMGAMAAGTNNAKLQEALALIAAKTASGEVSEAELLVRSRGERVAALKPDRIFLLASISKPMTATGLMVLVDRGEIRLDDSVRKFIPDFTGGDRDRITVKHLLTARTAERLRGGRMQDPAAIRAGERSALSEHGHTVGIGNRRAHHAHTIPGIPAALGLGGRKISETALCQVSGDDDWNWNSPYWRDLGAPWGGVHSTATDVTKFLDAFLHPDGRVLKRDTAAMMVRNQNPGLNGPWGITPPRRAGFVRCCTA